VGFGVLGRIRFSWHNLCKQTKMDASIFLRTEMPIRTSFKSMVNVLIAVAVTQIQSVGRLP